MGEFADYANEDQAQSLEDLLEYESGQMTDTEAFERGIIDGVHDVHSLRAELDRCELAFLRLERARNPEQFWVSGGKLYRPNEMTTQHLKNAVGYSERNGFTGGIVSQMRDELERRTK